MAVLGSTLLSLCFGTLLISASSADYPDRCMSFSTVFPTTGPGIKINSNIYESNRIYTISVPVDSSTNSVVLRAMDTNNNSSIGLWQRADHYCNGSVLYQRLDTREGFFKANWQSPRFTNITVEIHVTPNGTGSFGGAPTGGALTKTFLAARDGYQAHFRNPVLRVLAVLDCHSVLKGQVCPAGRVQCEQPLRLHGHGGEDATTPSNLTAIPPHLPPSHLTCHHLTSPATIPPHLPPSHLTCHPTSPATIPPHLPSHLTCHHPTSPATISPHRHPTSPATIPPHRHSSSPAIPPHLTAIPPHRHPTSPPSHLTCHPTSPALPLDLAGSHRATCRSRILKELQQSSLA